MLMMMKTSLSSDYVNDDDTWKDKDGEVSDLLLLVRSSWPVPNDIKKFKS